ncbi:hypothetical protein B0H10DRAFT_1937806 [Mycena sp. CBHHK59/15]|nr:hypothetical protein B0H10DRAFT_1937806 [Mycena sp. CBHHK59/15]
MYWLFTTEILSITQHISRFIGFFGTESALEVQFAPAMLFGLWRNKERWPNAQKHIRTMMIPCIHELALQDSDKIINSIDLRPRQKAKQLVPVDSEGDNPMSELGGGKDEDWLDDPNVEAGEGYSDSIPASCLKGILLTLSMLAFVQNRATKVLLLLLGLFFKISGTSSCVLLMLSNAGSGSRFGSLRMWFVWPSNSLLVDKFSLSFSIISTFSYANPSSLLGQRKHATAADILPTPEDDVVIRKLFVALIAEMIVSHCPGNREWKDHKDISAAVAQMMPLNRPQPPTKTDARLFGVFDVNEGSKNAVVKVLQSIQEQTTDKGTCSI